jgi:hypothetical protein
MKVWIVVEECEPRIREWEGLPSDFFINNLDGYYAIDWEEEE